jgi:hypothetical protein
MYKLICPACNKRNTVLWVTTTFRTTEIDSHSGTVIPNYSQIQHEINEFTCSNCRHTGKSFEFIVKEIDV